MKEKSWLGELGGRPWEARRGGCIGPCSPSPGPAGPQLPSTSSVRLASPSGWGLQEGRRSLPGSRGSPRSAPAVVPSSSNRVLRPETDAADSLRAAALELLTASISSSRPWAAEGGERARLPLLGLRRSRTREQGHRAATSPSLKAPSHALCPPLPPEGHGQDHTTHTTQTEGVSWASLAGSDPGSST